MRSTNAKHDPATLFLSIYPTVCILYPHLKGMLREALFVCTWNWTFTVAQTVKNLPAMQETWVQSLGREDPWRRKWQPTPVFLPGESHGQRSLAGYSPRGHKESDTTEWLTVLLLLFETGRKLKCPSAVESINLSWSFQPVEYCTVLKMNCHLLHKKDGIKLRDQGGKIQTQKNIKSWQRQLIDVVNSEKNGRSLAGREDYEHRSSPQYLAQLGMIHG